MTTAFRTLAVAALMLPGLLDPLAAAQAPASQSKDLARLTQLLAETGEKIIKERDAAWRASYGGDFTDSIEVFITTSNGLIIITSVVDHKVPATHAMLVSLMRLSYDTDFAKLGLDKAQALIALTEADLATTDGATLKRLIRGVATLTDRTVGLLIKSERPPS
jgi:hypothetical protein